MPAETMISCEALTERFGHFTAVDHVSFFVGKGSIFGLLGLNGSGKPTVICRLQAAWLNEPPELSPGLSTAMPWESVIQSNPRSEGAQERVMLKTEHPRNGRFSSPFRADGLFAARSQGIALMREALGCILMAFQATMSDFYTTF